MSQKMTFKYLIIGLCSWLMWHVNCDKYIETIKWSSNAYEVRLISVQASRKLNEIKFTNFDDFKKLQFYNFIERFFWLGYWKFIISFLPSAPTLLDRAFDSTDFRYFVASYFKLFFFHLRGLDVRLFEFGFSSPDSRHLYVYFYDSHLALYKSNRELLHQNECNDRTFTKRTYFGKISRLFFHYGTTYSKQTCKFIFKNMQADEVQFRGIRNGIVKRNLLGFIPDDNANIPLKVKVKNATLDLYQVNVNRQLLADHVFVKLVILQLMGKLDAIQADSFEHLVKIQCLYLSVSNLRQLYSHGIEWMSSFKSSVLVNTSNKQEIRQNIKHSIVIQTYKVDNGTYGTYFREPYLYPDEDFCWFAKFPFNRMVFLDPQMICGRDKCSCTQYWLLQYVHLMNEWNDDSQFDLSLFSFDVYDKQIEKCNFKERAKKCEHYKESRSIGTERTFQIALMDSQVVDFVIVILTPIVSSLGIIINIINIITISTIDLKKTPEEQQQKSLIKFMLAYSIINLIYCVIHALSLMSKCIDLNTVYCSELYFTQFGQYFKMIVVEFVGSCVKTFSNIVYFCISLNRYILLEKEGKLANFVKRSFAQWSKKKRTIWTLIISIFTSLLSAHKIVIYKAMAYSVTNLFNDYYPEFFFSLPFFLANSKFYEQYFNYDSDGNGVIHDKSTVYEAFTYINFILNDVVLFAVFTVIDILLVISFRKATEKKKNFYKDKLNDAKIVQLLNEMEQAVKNIIRIIIINTVILLSIKVFDLFMSVSRFTIWKEDLKDIDVDRKLSNFCYTVKICSVYEELVKILYMLYYCFSIVSFYYMNKNFRLNLAKTMKITKKQK